MLAEHFFSSGDSVAGDTLMLMNRTAPKMSDIRDVRLRVSLDPSLPITTDDVQGATVYVHPYNGNTIVLYSDGDWEQRALEEVLLVNETLAADTVYDLFLYWTGTAIAAEMTTWANTTTRAVALEQLDGVYVRSDDNTRRYIWSGATDSSGLFNDAQADRASWNQHNRVQRSVSYNFTGSWTVGAGPRPINNNSSIRVKALAGLGGSSVVLMAGLSGEAVSSGGATPVPGQAKVTAGIGVNSTSASTAACLQLPGGMGITGPAAPDTPAFICWPMGVAFLAEQRIGYTTYTPLESAAVTGGANITGSNGGIVGLVFA